MAECDGVKCSCCATLSLVVSQCQAMLNPLFVDRYAGKREIRGRNGVEGMRTATQLILALILDDQREQP